MDTTTVPEFKIAKVGQGRKRKGAGLPFFGGGSGGGGLFSGAVGGSGVGGIAGGMGLLGKLGVLALIGTISAGAWQVGTTLRPDETGGPAKRKLFSDSGHKYSDDDLSNVIRSNNSSMPNSLGFVSGSLGGLSAEERAKKEAEAAEAARLAEEEARKAEEEANAKPAATAGSPAGMDPNALMQGVNGGDKKESAFGKKYGALSSSFGSGGGLAGGSGLAGGVTRGFSNATLNNKGTSGKIASMRGSSNPSISRGAKARPGRSNNKGFARRQLGNAHGLSRQAVTTGKGETSAQTASSAFDNNAGAGNVISGPGLGTGTGGSGADAGASVNPSGPINPNDEAAPIASPKGKNATKYQNLVNAGIMLLGIIAIVAMIAMILEKMGWWGQAAATAFKFIIAALGASVIAIGAALMKQEPMIGGIYAASGALVVASAFIAPSLLKSASGTVVIAAGAIISSALGMLGGVMGANKGSSAAMS